MRTNFKINDKVFDIRFGWGTISYLYSTDWEKEKNDENLVCAVKFEKDEEVNYTKSMALKLLSFTEYTLISGIEESEEYYTFRYCLFNDFTETVKAEINKKNFLKWIDKNHKNLYYDKKRT